MSQFHSKIILNFIFQNWWYNPGSGSKLGKNPGSGSGSKFNVFGSTTLVWIDYTNWECMVVISELLDEVQMRACNLYSGLDYPEMPHLFLGGNHRRIIRQKIRQRSSLLVGWRTVLECRTNHLVARMIWRTVFGRTSILVGWWFHWFGAVWTRLSSFFSKNPIRQVAVILFILFIKSSWCKIVSVATGNEFKCRMLSLSFGSFHEL